VPCFHFRDNALEIAQADFPEQVEAIAVKVIHVQQLGIFPRHDPSQDSLTLYQLQATQITAIVVEHIECVKIRLIATAEKLIELRPAVGI
jgi:hypothetical protein